MDIKKSVFLLILTAAAIAPAAYADVTETTTVTTTTVTKFNEYAPIYAGPVIETELQELELSDFQRFGQKPIAAWDDFRDYQKAGKDPNNNEPRLYKMKVTRVLTLADFQAPNIDPSLSQARYDAYMKVVEEKKGEYVYVYYKPRVVVVSR